MLPFFEGVLRRFRTLWKAKPADGSLGCRERLFSVLIEQCRARLPVSDSAFGRSTLAAVASAYGAESPSSFVSDVRASGRVRGAFDEEVANAIERAFTEEADLTITELVDRLCATGDTP